MLGIILAVVFLFGMFCALALCAAAGRADRQSTALYEERKRAGLALDSGEFIPADELNKDLR